MEGKGSLPVLTEIRLLDDLSKYKQEYTGLMFTQLVCELIKFFAEEGQEDPGIYNNVWKILEVAQPQRYSLLAATIILRLLYNSGNLPKLNEDVYTSLELEPGAMRLSANPIGYTSQTSAALTSEPVPDRLYKVQRFIINQDYRYVQSIQLSPAEDIQLFNLHVAWLQNTLERELRTATMFTQSITSTKVE